MTRYIDADALYASIAKDTYLLTDESNSRDYGMHLIGIKKKIDEAPTADVVKVVRCKDCRHASECHKSVQYTRNEPNTVTIGCSQIEWCSRGERKEE